METSLQSANLTANELSQVTEIEDAVEEASHHIHLPNPSLWPLILSLAVLVAIIGLLFIPDSPWLTLVATPFILVGILGWALEDPMGSHEDASAHTYTNLSPQEILEQARGVVNSMVTMGSRAWSTHYVKVELEGPGAILALYGKVELQAQREAIEDAVNSIPGVVEVKNFIVAEDAILNIAHARIEQLQASGKLTGAKDISVLAENYILHLYGEVPDSKMKAALEREMISIPGVTVVVNHIGLNTDIPGNLGKTRNKVGG